VIETISSRTIIPVDDVRLATGERPRETRSMVTFSTGEMVTVGINGGLVGNTSSHLVDVAIKKGWGECEVARCE
jgi:hypothetical protein